MTANSRSPSVTHLAPSAGTSATAQIFTRSLMLPAPARSFFRRTIVARIEAVSLRVNQAAAPALALRLVKVKSPHGIELCGDKSFHHHFARVDQAISDLRAALRTKPEQPVLLVHAALSAPHESMNHAFFLRDLKPNPVGVRFVPVAEEMIDMVGLAREDRVGEIAVGFKLDDALIGFFPNGAWRIAGGLRAGPEPIESRLLPLAKIGFVALRKKSQRVVQDRIVHRHAIAAKSTKQRALPAPPGCPCSPPSSSHGD